MPALSNQASRRRLGLIAFAAIAAAVVVADQLVKAWVVGSFAQDRPSELLGDWLRIDLIHNAGGLFGMLQGSANVLGVVSIAVVVGLVAVELATAWRSWLLTLTIGLLLGGAIGNFIDRFRFGYVVDFVDIGIGAWRFYVFNIADSAVTVSLGLILVLSIAGPWLGRGAGATRAAVGAPGGVEAANGELPAKAPAPQTDRDSTAPPSAPDPGRTSESPEPGGQ
jgi:signal peptidase II